jgi:hypothetical protein
MARAAGQRLEDERVERPVQQRVRCLGSQMRLRLDVTKAILVTKALTDQDEERLAYA